MTQNLTNQPNFSKYLDGLVPVIIQDKITKNVLMLGFMNQGALEITKQIKKVTFWSRSKNRLWTKGEESGNFLLVDDIVKDILVDCDQDTILIRVNPIGNTCHTGVDTCFGEKNQISNLHKLEKTIQARLQDLPKDSYIASLSQKGINKIAQKVGEEAVEVVIESKDDNESLFLGECADLIFHLLILINYKGFELHDIVEVLEERGIPQNFILE
jgi:phosphoribosyl-ATP pyrophosphohydrolase/phosphoribosyl-AMP cyclohydrolase